MPALVGGRVGGVHPVKLISKAPEFETGVQPCTPTLVGERFWVALGHCYVCPDGRSGVQVWAASRAAVSRAAAQAGAAIDSTGYRPPVVSVVVWWWWG